MEAWGERPGLTPSLLPCGSPAWLEASRGEGVWPSVVDVVGGYVCYRIISSREACLSVLGFTSAGLGFGSLE